MNFLKSLWFAVVWLAKKLWAAIVWLFRDVTLTILRLMFLVVSIGLDETWLVGRWRRHVLPPPSSLGGFGAIQVAARMESS